MHFLAHTDTVWHRGPPSPPDDFISFGDLAAYEADRHTGTSASSFMTLFARNILSGTFDAEPLGVRRHIKWHRLWARLREISLIFVD
jgi:hypothetical protein